MVSGSAGSKLSTNLHGGQNVRSTSLISCRLTGGGGAQSLRPSPAAPGEVGDRKLPAEPFCSNVEQVPPQSLVHLQQPKETHLQFKASAISGEKLNRVAYEKEKPMEHVEVMSIDAASTAAPKNYEYAHDDSHMGPVGAMSRIKKLEDSYDDDQGDSQSVHIWSESVYLSNPNDEDEGSNVTTLLNETFEMDQIPEASEPADLTASPGTNVGTLSFSPSDVTITATEADDCGMNGELVFPVMQLCEWEGEMVLLPLSRCDGGLENSELVTGKI